jgi:hypothetical protein
MGVICTNIDAAIPAESLEANPNVGLNVFDQVPDMDRSVGVGQGTSDQYLSCHRILSELIVAFAFEVSSAIGIVIVGILVGQRQCKSRGLFQVVPRYSFRTGSEINPSFNPEPQATAVSTRDCRPETAGASGFGLNEVAVAVKQQPCETAVFSEKQRETKKRFKFTTRPTV